MYEETPVLKIVSKNENCRYKKNKARDIADFRLLFPWEEAELDSAIEWGIDNKIVLFENRVYLKTTDSTADALNLLGLAYLTEEAFTSKKTNMLNLINPSHDILEDLLKQELAVINDDLGGKINKLEENITDLKTLMNTTMESLKGLNKVNASKRKNFSIPGGIFFFESLQARLKQHLAAIALSYDPVLYTALDGCYEIYTANKDRFPLLDKVIAFINNTDKKTLLILAESGFGKTSFSVYLTRYLLNDSFTLSRNYRVLPFYLSLSRITTKNTETTTLESVLQHYYRFTQEEVDLLFENNQLNFCFIFDDVNESNLNMDFIRKICSRFSFSHYIFMAALSEFKSKQACERLLRSSYPGKGVSEEKTIYLAPFNKRAKKIIFLITWQALKKNYIQLILR